MNAHPTVSCRCCIAAPKSHLINKSPSQHVDSMKKIYYLAYVCHVTCCWSDALEVWTSQAQWLLSGQMVRE